MDHSTTFSQDDLRRAAEALLVIRRHGDDRELEDRLAAAWQPDEPGEPPLEAGILGDDLATMLHAPRAACERAAAEVIQPTLWRRRYQVLLDYAAELEMCTRVHNFPGAGKTPEPTLLDVYNAVGLDAMLDYGPPQPEAEEESCMRIQHSPPDPIPVVILPPIEIVSSKDLL